MLNEMSVNDFVELLASDAPAPGGGSISALNGALSSGLTAMVCALSLQREDLRERHAELKTLHHTALRLKDEFMRLVEEDTAAFNQVMAAFKLPKGTDSEKLLRSQAILAGYKSAIAVPLQTARFCLEAVMTARAVSEGFNANTASDLGVAVSCAVTGLKGAVMNIRINLPSVKKDGAYAESVARECDALETGVQATAGAVCSVLKERFGI